MAGGDPAPTPYVGPGGLIGSQGVVSSGASGAAVTPAWGTSSNRAAGNLLILIVGGYGTATATAAPSGWTLAKAGSGTNCTSAIYWRIATGADAAPTVAAVAGTMLSAQLIEFTGYPANPVNTGGFTAGTTSPIVVNTTGNAAPNDLIVGACAAFYTVATAAVAINHTVTVGGTQATLYTSTNNPASIQSHWNNFFTVNPSTANPAHDSMVIGTLTNLGGAVDTLATFTVAPPALTATAQAKGGAYATLLLPVSALQDSFPGTTLNSNLWVDGSGDTTTNNGLILAATWNYGLIYSNNSWIFTESSMLAQFTPLPTGASYFVQFQIVTAQNDSPGYEFYIDGSGSVNVLHAKYTDLGYNVTDEADVNIPASPIWLRIRMSGGIVYWDYAPDGVAWTNLHSQPDTFGPTYTNAMWPSLTAGHGTQTDPDLTENIYDFNLPPPQVQEIFPAEDVQTAGWTPSSGTSLSAMLADFSDSTCIYSTI